MKILITGIAGFIGFHLAKSLLERGDMVIGIDNINSHYDVELKYDRLFELGINKEKINGSEYIESDVYHNFLFRKLDLTDKRGLQALFAKERPDKVCNLAAQAGVRLSITDPDVYIKANVEGFLNMLEMCRIYPVELFVYASSSSVYGLNREPPFTTEQKTDQPINLYAATKKTNELFSHAYSYLYKIPAIGLRFFTVYGPWGRPDMAPYIFAKSIVDGTPINVYGNGVIFRDFTYIDDIIHSIELILKVGIPKELSNSVPNELYNTGSGNSVCLMDFIAKLESYIGKEVPKIFHPKHDADMILTLAETSGLRSKIGYSPTTRVEEGIQCFADWFLEYYESKMRSR